MASVVSEAWHTTKATLSYSHVNVLLVCVPLGIFAAEHGWDPAFVFALNFLAMFPLAAILTFSTEQLAAKVGSVFGGLINATFGNAVEMIVGISALREGEIRIVQWSMVGSILSSTLLILGCCFFAGGLGKKDVDINIDVAGILTSLSVISSVSLIIPSALHAADPSPEQEGPSKHILAVSRVASIVLLAFYIVYVYFQTKSHSHLFADSEEDEECSSELGVVSATIVLIAVTLAVSVCSDHLVDSVGSFVDTLGISRAFVGLIIVPILGNGGEFAATVSWAKTGKINLAIGSIVGSTLQISLFVTPFLVVLGWMIGRPMSLQFDTFDTAVLALSVLIVNCLVRDGSTNYFEGLLLIGTYLIIAIAFFVQPDAQPKLV